MSVVRANKILGAEQTHMKIQMDSTSHLNIQGKLETGDGGQICIPSGTTAERPSSPQKGMIRINETKLGVEVYDGSDWLLIVQPPVGGAGGPGSGETTAVGQQAYTSAGNSQWTCPENVYEVSVVCVGGGGGSTRDEQGAGGGAGLGWANLIPVEPGQSYQVQVGAKGTPASPGNYAGSGGQSFFIDTATVYGGGGGGTGRDRNGSANRPGYGGQGGGYGGNGGVQQGGGYGGNGGDGNRSSLSDTGQSCGGGGAGGYSGNGGYGGHHNSGWGRGSDGAGGGGGGGYGSTEGYGGGGGGVGLLGQGSNGQNTTSNGGAGTGGSGGSAGQGNVNQDQDVPGGDYGGGAGSNDQYGSYGGVGGVRIIWGQGRAFPNTLTSDQ